MSAERPEAMQGTQQTSRRLEGLGPFFVGRKVWQGRGRMAEP